MSEIGYISAFVPPEWIAAHGLTPRRIVPGTPRQLAAGMCPLAAGFRTLDSSLNLAGLILTSTCDQMRRTAEELQPARHPPIFLLNVPATWQFPGSRAIYRAELLRLTHFLIACGGTAPTSRHLIQTLRDYEAARDASCSAQATPSASGPRLALLGPALGTHADWLLKLLAQHGARLVLDATETGERGRPARLDEAQLERDPVEALVEAYFGAIPDAFRRPDVRLYDFLRREIAARQVQGLVLIRYVWCDLWHAHLARLRDAFGLPVVELDLGEPGETLARAATRVEALLEMLQ